MPPTNCEHANITYSEISYLVRAYNAAKCRVIEKGFIAEIEWQERTMFESVTESSFLCEAAWVVLSSGMRESIVRKLFGPITQAFCRWESAARITNEAQSCIDSALTIFRHPRKIAAIASIASRVNEIGFAQLKSEICLGGVPRLREFPFMGPATSFHLAKNLGMDVVKPDRHLVRIANAAGYGSPERLCRDLSEAVGDRIGVVDLVLWRFATFEPEYVQRFSGSMNYGHTVSV